MTTLSPSSLEGVRLALLPPFICSARRRPLPLAFTPRRLPHDSAPGGEGGARRGWRPLSLSLSLSLSHSRTRACLLLACSSGGGGRAWRGGGGAPQSKGTQGKREVHSQGSGKLFLQATLPNCSAEPKLQDEILVMRIQTFPIGLFMQLRALSMTTCRFSSFTPVRPQSYAYIRGWACPAPLGNEPRPLLISTSVSWLTLGQVDDG